MRDKIAILFLCLAVVFVAWHAENREAKLLDRINVLAKENAGLEARVTRKALHAYCQAECGSCFPREAIMSALTGAYRQ